MSSFIKVSEKKDENLQSKSKYYQFGWKYFGPFLYGFTDWLCHELKGGDINKIFFFSRDGYMMKKAFDMMNKDENMQVQYVYFSRKSIRQTLLWNCNTYEESLQYLTWERFISLGKLLEYYGFSKRERFELSQKHKWDLNKEYEYSSLNKNIELSNIYKKLKQKIDDKSCKQGVILKQYIQQIGMDGDCAIIDIGWKGSMQYYIEQFLLLNDINCCINGYYVGILPERKLKGNVYGFLYNPENPNMRKSVLCAFGVYEKLFQSTEGSTYGYKMEDGLVKPILNTYEYHNNPQIISCIYDWQTAALDYITQRMKQTDHVEDDIALAQGLVRVGKKPTYKETKMFSFFYNTDGTKVYFVKQKALYKYKIKELIHALSNSPWKTGFMKSAFRIPFPYYKIYEILRK